MAPTYTPETKHTGTFTAETFGRTGGTTASAGLYYGFGAFTYSGGQVLVSGTLPTFTSESKTP